MIEGFLQIDDGLGWLHVIDPLCVVEAYRADEVAESLRRVERLTRSRGWHAVGYVRYEAGAAYGLDVCAASCETPLVWFALFEASKVRKLDRLPQAGSYRIGSLSSSIERGVFGAALREIRERIAAGDTYQVNYTWRLSGIFRGDPLGFFADLSAAQRGRYGAFLHTDRYTICSASPELFFRRDLASITARPMKGTTRRGRFPIEDRRLADQLRESLKERAENVMVVDMVRNDVGRIAKTGTVDVPALFTLERYPNVWQMTSTVTAQTAAPLDEIFGAMFPSASVTGAPKHRTMQIIAALERRPRGIYTGAVGRVAPDGSAHFNVAIRTAVIERSSGALDFGVGSGIVWDSKPDQEYDECLLKGSVVGRRPPSFDLLETLRWSPAEGFFLLERHLTRLGESAGYFGFVCEPHLVRDALARAVAAAQCALRIRLRVAEDGTPTVDVAPLDQSPDLARVALARGPIDQTDIFLFHKTTNRGQYDRARSSLYDDVILWNAKGEVTESTTANIVVEIDGDRVTPPVDCGLLAGTFRAELLARGELTERSVTIDQLHAAARLWLVNSVRGWRRARLARDWIKPPADCRV